MTKIPEKYQMDFDAQLFYLLIEKSPRTVHEILSETGFNLNIVKSRIDRFSRLGLIELEKKEIYQLSLVSIHKDKIEAAKSFLY
ncbi:hypothetical protein COU60_05235 [Candidatus Pacearchaeota archaeon CG10_big_fil_rev_8_21_14_0_10_34_76]|nr:MAG: hypothetical protein COU60_05235 [Candidatus Pacearchaeota archaeon CG10_big_fil_rev_8_21_14_0_10_34_76]